jgi:hypothetical protein
MSTDCNQTRFVGIDVAKQEIEVCVVDRREQVYWQGAVPRRSEELRELAQRLSQFYLCVPLGWPARVLIRLEFPFFWPETTSAQL